MNRFFCAGLLACSLISLSSSQTLTWVNTTATLTAGKSFPAGITGCSGVRANRLTGEIYVHCIQNGIWKTSNKGQTWTRIDQNTVGGRNETGWGLDQDQEHPTRLANFSLDGTAAWTADGVTWKTMTGVGRNWDYGSVDWASTNPKTIFACTHEAGGFLDVSTDGGTTWKQLTAKINSGSALATNSMVGVMDSMTLIYHTDNNGIQRSTDLGTTWNQVSTVNPQSRVPVLFKNVHYLCAATGLLVSRDKGATWSIQGAAVNIFQGPFFGGSEDTMVTVGNLGVYYSANAGATWTRIGSNLVPAYGSDQANYWATFAWDPVNRAVYATRMTYDGYRTDLPTSTTVAPAVTKSDIRGFSIVNSRIHSAVPFDGFALFALDGSLRYQWRGNPTHSVVIPTEERSGGTPLVCRITSVNRSSFQSLISSSR